MKDIITIVGFLGAGYLFFAWYGKSEQPLNLGNEITTEQAPIAEAGVYDYDAAAERPLERPNEVSGRKSRDNERQLAVVTPSTSKKNSKISASQLQRAVTQLADVAVTAAIDKRNGVPAGASLTLLIMGAEKGKQLNESNLRKIIHLLRSTKADAPKADLQYFKYTSNSEKWFEGLQLDHNGGYNIGDLLRIYDQYDLRKYDKDVMSMVAGAKIEYSKTYAPKTATPAMEGDASDETVRRNYAFAKNRWAEKEAANTEADLKFVAAKEKDANVASALHREVAALEVGESLRYNNPDEYHAALKELIAVENGFSSWKKYEAELGKDQARRVFRKRSEKGGFFASGGLKITRER
ncbi:MAG: hypothetical protein ACK4TA_03030 [Saprospiraceae bacterium]